MTAALPLILAVIAVISFTAYAQEVAYAYGESGGRLLEGGNITEYNSTDIVTSSIASAAYNGKTTSQRSLTRLEDLKREINLKLNVRNPVVIDKGCSLVLNYPGDGTIGQICSIYEYMVDNWSYKRDPRGIEVFQYSNQSLKYGNGKYSGQGDCDDFSILLASLIESIGCTSRIVLAYGPNGGHAYAEVYLGKAGGPESDVGRILSWLEKKYKVKEINTHPDMKTGDVWLNLDMWKGQGGAKHPGGPFFRAAEQVPIWIREDIPWVPLKPMNELPIAQFSISPLPPVVGENTSFDATKSRDIGGRVESYLWDFGDGNKTEKMSEPVVSHVYAKGGPYMVVLTIWDDEDEANISSQKLMVNNPPQANFTIEPQRPKVGDQVKFDASSSCDAEDGKRLEYYWEINNSSDTFNQVIPRKQVFDEAGRYWVNLTVSDTNGAMGHKDVLLKINQPPIARIALDSANLSLGRMINFTAAPSEDLDGEIVGYAWDFGDNREVDCKKTAFHRYHDGGEKMVRLSVTDNDGTMSNISQDIIINYPPIAKFSLAPLEPEKGELVSFNASESYDPDGRVQRYLWDFGVGKVEPEIYYSEFAEHTYNRPMEYNITLTVVDDRDTTGSISKMIEVKDINKMPIVDLLQPDEKSPQMVGSTITWTAKASDPEDDPLHFQFSLDGQVMQDWSESSVWRWLITNEQVGLHRIEATVRDGRHNSEGDSSNGADFEVIPLTMEAIAAGRSTANEPPVLTDLYPEMPVAPGLAGIAKLSSPIHAGWTVFWIAEASDPEDDPLQFQFSLDGQVTQNWSKRFAWCWTPTKEQVGNHIIEAKVIDGKHSGSDSSDFIKSLNFSVIEPDLNPVDASRNSSHSYMGSTSGVVYSGSGRSAPHSTINTTLQSGYYTTSIANYSNSSIIKSIINATPYLFLIGGLLASDYYSTSQCLSCANTTEIEFAAVHDDNSTFWLNRGDELFALGRCDEAIEAYNRSYMLDRKNAQPLFGKGRAFYAKGEYEEALIWVTAAIELSPQYKLSNSAYADMWIYKGNALMKLGRDGEADASFDKAEDLDPSRHPEMENMVESCA